MNLVLWMNPKLIELIISEGLPIPAIIKPIHLWTGKQVISLIFPRGLAIRNMSNKGEGFANLHENNVIIKNGQLLTGTLTK